MWQYTIMVSHYLTFVKFRQLIIAISKGLITNYVLDSSLLNTLQYKVRIKSKVEQSRERSSALQCSGYWKGSLLVALD